MNQGHSGVKEVIQEKQSKHCLVTVERGSFYPGTGMAQFDINYSKHFSVLILFARLLMEVMNWKRKEKEKKNNTKLCATASDRDSSNFFEKYV